MKKRDVVGSLIKLNDYPQSVLIQIYYSKSEGFKCEYPYMQCMEKVKLTGT